MAGSPAAALARSRVERALDSLPPPPLEALARPLDLVRGRLLERYGVWVRRLVLPRTHGAPLVGAGLLVLALASATSLPLWVVALGPLVWGVPHVVSDVRYLVAGPDLHKSAPAWLAFGVALAGQAAGYGVRAGLAAAAVALLLGGGSWTRRVVGLALVGALLAAAQRAPWTADVVFVQAHNFVGVGLWLALRPRSLRHDAMFVGVLAAGAAVVFLAPLDPWLVWTGGLRASWTGLDVADLAATLSPVQGGPRAIRFILFYAFAQTAHYVVWLGLVPQRARRGRSLRSFRQSLRALRRDVGATVVWLAVLTALTVSAIALVKGLAVAREVYLGIAFFHTHLELVAAALLFARPARGPAGAG